MTHLLLLLSMLLATDAPLTADATADEVLVALEARGDDLDTLSADVELRELDAVTGRGFTRTGRVWLKDARADQPTLRLTFDKRIDGQRLKTTRLDYLLAGNVLIEHDEGQQATVERRLAAPGEKLDLFRLGSGPFPLPVGQDADEVRAAFEVELLGPGAGDDGGTVGLLLIPRDGSPMHGKAAEVEVWVDVATSLPRKVVTLSVDESIERTTLLTDAQVNADVPADRFELPPVPDDWRRTVE